MRSERYLKRTNVITRQANRHWILEALHGPAFDHPTLEAFPEGDYLNFAIGRVR